MTEHRTYVLEGDYGDRKTEGDFIKHALHSFDKDTLTGCGVFVNNHLYNLQLFIYFSLENHSEIFENFVDTHYRSFKRKYKLFAGDMFESMQERSGNLATFLDDETVDMIMTDHTNSTFIWPARRIIDQKWSRFVTPINFNVFLSHKSSDKLIARRIRDFLSSSEISVWFDEEEILPGMSIIDSINDGLSRSKGCIALISDAFLQSITKWTRMEINYFVGLLGGGGNNYIVPILVGVNYRQLPPFLQDMRALTYGEEDWEEKLLSAIRRHSA